MTGAALVPLAEAARRLGYAQPMDLVHATGVELVYRRDGADPALSKPYVLAADLDRLESS